MEIEEVLKRLHNDYKKRPSLGCADRASILYHFMKSKGLKAEIKAFYFEDDPNAVHWVVIIDNKVYDSNEEDTKNPLDCQLYEENKQKIKSYVKCNWKSWEELSMDKNYFIDYLWKYLARFDADFQTEIRSLINKEYYAYIKKHPGIG